MSTEGMAANGIYEHLISAAESLKIKDIQKRYKSLRAVAQRLANIKDGLSFVRPTVSQTALGNPSRADKYGLFRRSPSRPRLFGPEDSHFLRIGLQ